MRVERRSEILDDFVHRSLEDFWEEEVAFDCKTEMDHTKGQNFIFELDDKGGVTMGETMGDWKDGYSAEDAKEHADFSARLCKIYMEAFESQGFNREESIMLALKLVPLGFGGAAS